MRRAQVAVGAARDFGQAVEHRIAGELARGRIFDIQEVLAVRLAVADDQAGAAERDRRQAVQAMAGLVETRVERVEFIVDVVLGMLYVDTHGKGRPSRAVRESGSSQRGKEWLRPRPAKRAGAANQLGMCWKPAAIAARPAMQSANRIRTLWITSLSSRMRGAGGRHRGDGERRARPRGRRAGRRSKVRATARGRALYRTRTGSTIRDVIRVGNRTEDEKRRKAENRVVSRQLAA